MSEVIRLFPDKKYRFVSAENTNGLLEYSIYTLDFHKPAKEFFEDDDVTVDIQVDVVVEIGTPVIFMLEKVGKQSLINQI